MTQLAAALSLALVITSTTAAAAPADPAVEQAIDPTTDAIELLPSTSTAPTIAYDLLAESRSSAPSTRSSAEPGRLEPAGRGHYKAERTTFTAHVDPDGTVHLHDKPNLQIEFRGLAIVGRFDLTDWAMRSFGQDPYASAKLQFLDSTRDERAAIGSAHRRAQLARSAELMRANIARAWATERDPQARRRALFELWDECADAGDGTLELVAGGSAARETVVAYIRTHLRGRDAYSEQELARFNTGRVSVAAFSPYAAPTDCLAAR